MRRVWLLMSALAMAVGCSSDVGNVPAAGGAPVPGDPVRWRAGADCMAAAPVGPGDRRETLARRCLDNRPERERDFIAVALSGGGTKAAVFSAETMFYLEALGLMRRASVLSSVSGGSFAAALYALSCDPDGKDATGGPGCVRESSVRGPRRPVWRHDEIMRTVGQGYQPLVAEQVARFLVPVPAVRGTISAGGFARFIDERFFGTRSAADARFLFADLNPRRPHLVLNATILSPNRGGLGSSGGKSPACALDPGRPRGWLRRRNPDEFFHFAYTDVYFGLLGSDLSRFPVSGAVAASAAFPVLIDQAALVDHCRDEAEAAKDRNLLLMDGGANDNQGMVEIYHMLTEMVLGQRRSGVRPGDVERLGAGDAAYIFVVNSSVTDTTGPTWSGSGSGPVGAIGWISEVVQKTLNSVDVYSATAFNLRKNYYVSEARRVDELLRAREGRRRPVVWPLEIGLTGLDQYRAGGAQAALWKKSGLLDKPEPGELTDPTLRELQKREKLQREVLRRVMPARGRLRLSDHHPQCYYDIRDRLDASLVSLGEDEQACLREAARWSTALVAQGLCTATEGHPRLRPPDGLRCDGGVVSLRHDRVLGEGNDVGGSCEAILGPLIENQRRDRERQARQRGQSAPGLGEDDCQRLPAG